MASTENKDREVITAKDLDDLFDRIEWRLIMQAHDGGNVLKRVEWALIKRAIKEHGGNKTEAARFLGRTYRWLRKIEAEQPPHSD